MLFLLPALAQAQVTVTVTGTNVTCFGLNNGTATALGSGGWAPYTYLWSTGQTTATITGLAPGTYNVTVTDIDLGTGVGSITITQPPQLGVTLYGESQICGIAPDGKATAVPYGGTPPYTYLWNTGGTTAQITGLPAGTYTVTVTDANGCTVAGSTTVFFWDEGVWIMDNSVNVTCFGLNNGSIQASGMSGTPPYTFHWSNGANTPDITNLAPGTYTVTVTDANGCSNTHTVTITQPTILVAVTSTTPGVCGVNGSATVSVSGATPPYTVLWSNGSASTTITAPAGTYTVTVTDGNGCTKSASATINTSPNNLLVTTTVLSSAGCTIGGSASATASGGSGNYAFSWTGGQTGSTATNLPVGTYTVTVVDITSGCTGTASVNIPAAPTLTTTATVQTNATCAVGGSAIANPAGGTPPYTFKWDNNQTTAIATNLGAGPHTVTVTDSKGCTAVASVQIGQTQGPTVTATVNNNATCTTLGSANATATGGTSPYVYLWSNGANTATVNGLSAGTYNVTVTDAGGCSAAASVTITQSGVPNVVISSSTGAGCIMIGSATAGSTGGTPPYTFKWSNGAMGATISNLGPGTYTVTVTDAAGCTGTSVVSIAAGLPPNVVISGSTNATCSQPGSATANASGAAPPFTYQWDSGETTATAVNLPAGVHTVTVTDGLGCTATASVTIGSTNNGIKIGDYVWYDDDQDGFQHPLETNGVPNITVKLMKAGVDGVFGTIDDVTVSTTTTNANGKYLFDCVVPGTYILMFTGGPIGYQWTGKDKVNNDCLDSDVKSNGKTDPFNIVAGQADNLCYDAGIHIFCDNVTNAGLICCDQVICEGETPALFYAVSPPTGGSGIIQYQWLQLIQIGPAPPTWMGIPGANSATYQAGPLFETSYFMRCARRENCITFLESNIVKVTVLPAGSPDCGSFIQNLSVNPNNELNVVQISWKTIPEATQYLYTVQHSVDEIDWDAISTVMGKQDPVAPNDYTAVDQTPANGKNFYRIKRSSANGVDAFSEVKSIDMSITSNDAISIFPNPATDALYIRNAMKYESDVTITIVATNGKVLNTVTIPQGTIQQLDIPMKDLPEGLYLVRIKFGSGDVKTLKITKF